MDEMLDPQEIGVWKAVLRAWHEQRMKKLEYPPAVQAELRAARERWLAACPNA